MKANWYKMTLKPEWIPENISDILTAEKDVRKFQSTQNDMVICRLEGDYIVAKYEIKGHKIIIQESGVSISIRIEKAASEQNKTPENLIEKNLMTYLNIPANTKFFYNLNPGKKIVFGTAIDEKISVHKNEWDWWWQHFSVCIAKNDSLFFVYIYERKGYTERMQARPGYPDRF